MNLVRVATPAAPGFTGHWSILPTLSDRWGDLLDSNMDASPYHQLVADADLLERLRSQMWDETTFVAHLDGQFGLLYEAEFMTQESDKGPPSGVADEKLSPEASVRSGLLARIPTLEQAFPGVRFCVPDTQMVFNGRTALWAFVADGLLDAPGRERLGNAVLNEGSLEGAPFEAEESAA